LSVSLTLTAHPAVLAAQLLVPLPALLLAALPVVFFVHLNFLLLLLLLFL